MFENWSSNVLPRLITNTIIKTAKKMATMPSTSPATPIPLLPPPGARAREIAIAAKTIASAPSTNPNTTVNDRTIAMMPMTSDATASPPVAGVAGGATGITGGTGGAASAGTGVITDAGVVVSAI